MNKNKKIKELFTQTSSYGKEKIIEKYFSTNDLLLAMYNWSEEDKTEIIRYMKMIIKDNDY